MTDKYLQEDGSWHSNAHKTSFSKDVVRRVDKLITLSTLGKIFSR